MPRPPSDDLVSLRARVERALDDALDLDAYRGRAVTLTVPDRTRPLPWAPTLGPLLERLEPVADELRVIVGLGLHRPLTDAERAPLVALCQAHDAALERHDARDPGRLVRVREDVGLAEGARRPLPVEVHRAVAQADRIICVGIVEPHQYAGFSGGVKGVAIGCAGEATISAMHGLTYLRDPGTQLGRLEGNPFRAALRRIGAALPPIDALQIAPLDPPRVRFGPASEALEGLASEAGPSLFVEHAQAYDWAHLPVEGPKGVNLYQASRAATYVGLVDRPVVRPGGWLVLEARCPEGVGQGAGERACAEALGRGLEALLAELEGGSSRALRGGEQRAFVIARLLRDRRLALVGAPAMPALQTLGVPQFDSIERARRGLELEPAAGATLRRVFHRVPRLRG